MSTRELLRRHVGFFALVAAFELAIAWAASRLVVGSLRRHLAVHPDGLRALFSDGGRGSVDLVLGTRPERLFAPAIVIVGSTSAKTVG